MVGLILLKHTVVVGNLGAARYVGMVTETEMRLM